MTDLYRIVTSMRWCQKMPANAGKFCSITALSFGPHTNQIMILRSEP
jgi:hypothetical protein